MVRIVQGAAAAIAAFGMLVAVQVVRLRRLRLLPGHPGFWISHVVAPSGGDASGARLFLVVFGDSTTAGVGVDDAEASLPYRIAQLVADARGRPVRVLSYGWAGARVADVSHDQVAHALRPRQRGEVPPLRAADLVAVVVGANDATHRTRPTRFRRDLRLALDRIGDAAPAAELVVAGVPRLRGALPHLEPLISLAHAYAAPLRRIQRQEAERAGAAYADLARDVLPRLRGRVDPATAMSADGFHPGPPVYAAWAEVIAEALEKGPVTETPATRPRAAR
ncbi:MAG: GDSL-type esterase/lipase family protein [Chloroflexota bacterium]